MNNQQTLELDNFLLESNFDFQYSPHFTWALMETAIRANIMKSMSTWFAKEEFDPEAGFILSYCSGDIRHHISALIVDFMEAWCK